MGRPRKIEEGVVEEVLSEEVSVDEVADAAEEGVEESAPVSLPTKNTSVEIITITARYKTRTIDGDRVEHKYKGAGNSVEKALDSVVGSDEDVADEFNRPFPTGINMLVNVTVRTSKDYEYSRALAPHVARSIFEQKNAALVRRLFGLGK
jgi:hypothetical protein